ncbi:MAG: BTAD domain-containing putative transcriptional regulator [Anaerolineae bacterium]
MSLQFQLLGRPQVLQDGRDATGEVGAKALAVITFLALAPTARVTRSKVAGTFWPDKTEEAARYRLRHLLWDLRKTLESDCIGSDNAECWFNPEGATVDALELRRGAGTLGLDSAQYIPTAEQASQLAALAELYHGDLFDGLPVREAPLFDEWLFVERERLHLLYLDLLWALARALQSAGDCAGAARTLARSIQLDPLRERNYRALMAVYYQAGDRSAATQAFHQCESTLSAELGVAPSPETRQLYNRIVRGTTSSVETDLRRAGELVEQGRLADAFTLCATAEPLATDPIIRSQLSLLRAEIAIRQGKAVDSLSLLQSARQAIASLIRG